MRRPARAVQRGLVALVLVLVLLFAMSLALLWTGRSLVFEQRAAANQQRQAQAFAAAESGLAWALARLNDPRPINDRCVAVAAGPTFRDRYAAPWIGAMPQPRSIDTARPDAPFAIPAGYAPPAGPRALCSLGADAIACQCAASPGAPAALGTAAGPTFIVELAAIAGEARALGLTARGCSSDWAGCTSTPQAQTEAQAVVHVKLRLVDPVGPPRPVATGPMRVVEALRTGPLAVVPGSWRDGHCSVEAADVPCDFAP